MTPEDYDKMVKHQNGGCAICHTPTSEGQSLHVDHDHSCCSGEKSCGKCIRGLLCQKCNHALGLLGDNILKLEKAIDYLTPSKFVVEEVA
jgi:hypothetical protein